jgi:hypothetical protein
MANNNSVITGRFLGDLNRLKTADTVRREAAKEILHPYDIANKSDAAKLLHTTLGGIKRAITHADLKQFAQSAKQLGKQFKGGITAQQVIDLSLPIDRARANKDINTAVPMSIKDGVIHFLTNASAQSVASRHHVNVQFMPFTAFANSPESVSKSVATLLRASIRFDCDCGRHTFWYRYMATTGNYHYGRPETGFPKIRNPHLVGVACKHVLRVMQAIKKDLRVKAMLTKALEQAQTKEGISPAAIKAKVSEAKQHAKEQAAKTTVVSVSRPNKAKAKTKQASAAQKSIASHAQVLLTSGEAKATKKALNALAAVHKLGVISDKKYAAAIKQLTQNI